MSSLSLDLGTHLIIAIARSDRRDQRASVVSAAADIDIGAACRRALKELSANRLTVQYEMMKAADSLPNVDPSKYSMKPLTAYYMRGVT